MRDGAFGPDRRAIPSWFGVFYAACIIGMSVQAIISMSGVHTPHAWVAVLEIVGAILLVVPRTRMAGLMVLLVVFAVAGVITLHARHLPLYLVLYAGTAVLVARSGESAERHESLGTG